ncbi:hypothetical protein [Streptococcus suis]|nr:hypothetical protein [Streptococcus suis]AER18172.1 conserved hypothetical protein [Streptococcus suis D9]
MELVMPNNYVVLEEEEMMYLDGGEIATAMTGFENAFYAKVTGK